MPKNNNFWRRIAKVGLVRTRNGRSRSSNINSLGKLRSQRQWQCVPTHILLTAFFIFRKGDITKGIECEGKRSRVCPEGVPSPCGRWPLEFFDDQKQWVSLSFKDVRSKKDAERRLAIFIADRERGKLNLPGAIFILRKKEHRERLLN